MKACPFKTIINNSWDLSSDGNYIINKDKFNKELSQCIKQDCKWYDTFHNDCVINLIAYCLLNERAS